jgi:hypothetical protein
MEHDLFSETKICTAFKNFPAFFGLEGYHRVNNSQPVVRILSHMCGVDALPFLR